MTTSGTSASINNVNCQLVRMIKIKAPQNVITCEIAVETSLVINERTVATSLVARLTSSPVRRSL